MSLAAKGNTDAQLDTSGPEAKRPKNNKGNVQPTPVLPKSLTDAIGRNGGISVNTYPNPQPRSRQAIEGLVPSYREDVLGLKDFEEESVTVMDVFYKFCMVFFFVAVGFILGRVLK